MYNKDTKVLIAIPCMETVETEFIKCLLCLEMPCKVHIEFLSGSLVYASRDRLTDFALQGGFDYVLWLDSDMIFNSTLLKDLLEQDEDIVSGIYFTRKAPLLPCFFDELEITDKGGTSHNYVDYPQNAKFEVKALGFGAVLTKVSVLEDIVNHYHTAFQPIINAGEDIAFCIRARELGYKIYCNSAIKVGHIMRCISSEDTFKALNK